MLHYPTNLFGQALVPYETLDIPKGAEILKSIFFGSSHRPFQYLFPIKDIIY